jgi:hypothetical protein
MIRAGEAAFGYGSGRLPDRDEAVADIIDKTIRSSLPPGP